MHRKLTTENFAAQKAASSQIARRSAAVGALGLVLLAALGSPAIAQRGGQKGVQKGGQRGGSMGRVGATGARPMGGGGMARPSQPNIAARPQMPASRPSLGNAAQAQRPSRMPANKMPGNLGAGNLGAGRPGTGSPMTRPSFPSGGSGLNPGGNRPSLGGFPTNKLPGTGGAKPGISFPGASLPGVGKPGVGKPGLTTKPPGAGGLAVRPNLPSGGNRPNLKPAGPLLPTTKPAFPARPGDGLTTRPGGNFPPGKLPGGIAGQRPGDRPSLGGATRPTPLPGIIARPTPGGDRPSTLPGNIGQNTRPSPLPGTLPGNRPGIGGNRPGTGGAVTLPGIVNRPEIGGPNRPGIGGPDRPDFGKPGRPGIGGSNRPDFGRPDFGRPDFGGNNNWNNRPGHRPGWGDNNWTNINIDNNNNWTINNFNRPAWDRPGHGWNRPGWGLDPGYNHWHNNWHDHCIHPHYHSWYNGCWSGYWNSSWYSPIAWGAVGWGLANFSNNPYASYVYANPYYVPATTIATSVPYDYSQPIVINNYATSDSTSEGATATEPVIDAGMAAFDKGLSAFKSGDYRTALGSLNQALQQNPGDPVVHEVRALTLFALGEYSQAAAALNSLLASAPGMDWTSLSSLYGAPDDYSAQLRKLEEYCEKHPTEGASHFVLAYHYLVIGAKDQAIAALKVVTAAQPKDVTAKRMLEALVPVEAPTASNAAQPEQLVGAAQAVPSNPLEPAAPQPETDLVGTWNASSNKSSIELTITEDSKFTWRAQEDSKVVAELSGDLVSSSDAIILETGASGSLSGAVISKSPDAWTFLPPGAKSESDGIQFVRKK